MKKAKRKMKDLRIGEQFYTGTNTGTQRWTVAARTESGNVIATSRPYKGTPQQKIFYTPEALVL